MIGDGPGTEVVLLWMIGFILAAAVGLFVWSILMKDEEV